MFSLLITIKRDYLIKITGALLKITVILMCLQSCLSNTGSPEDGSEIDFGELSQISFQLDSLSSNSNQLYQKVGDELYVMNQYINGIDKYSLKTGKLNDRILLNKEGADGIPFLDGFYVFNADSILVFSERNVDGLFLKDGTPSSRVSDYVSLDRRVLNHHIATALPVMAYDGKLFIFNLPFGGEIDNIYQTLDYVVDFKLDTTYFIKSTKKLQDLSQYPGQFSFAARCLVPDRGEIVYTYQFSDRLMIYNLERSDFTEKSLMAPSIGEVKFNAGFKTDEEIYLANNLYGAVVWNSYTKHLYRFVQHAVGSNDRSRSLLDQPISVLIADSAYTFQKEVLLTPTSKFLIKDFWFSDEGLMISSANFNNIEIDEDEMSFSVLNY